jgi:signal transduction histidine kinase
METLFENHTITFHLVEETNLRTLGIRGAQYMDLSTPILGKGITAKSAREQKSILVNDTSLSPEFIRGNTDAKSELSVPAILDGETIAVLNVESQKLNNFTEEDRKLLETLAYHVGFAFNRIKQQETEELQRREVSNRFDYALGRLDHAERVSILVKGELQRNILSIINASLMLRHKPDLTNRLAESIDKNADKAQVISEQIRDQVAKYAIDDRLIEVNQMVRSVLENSLTPKNIRLKTQYDNNFLITEIEENNFNRILRNLIDNSIEAMPEGGTLSLRVALREDNAIIEVMDTGPGINEKALNQLFQPFNTSKKGHSGLGLAFCKNALESVGGTIELKSTSNKGTVFVIRLPLISKL